MRLDCGNDAYEWIDDWAGGPQTDSAQGGWAHHGVVVTEAGEVIAFHQGESTVLVFDRDGSFLRSWNSDLTDAHGMTLVEENGTEYLWIADNGAKRQPSLGYEYATGEAGGQVVKMTLDDTRVMSLKRPNLPVYRGGGKYSPTWVAVNEERHGGNGDVWVADGYGASYVHRFSKNGDYIDSINGEEGGGAFDCPHAIFIDRRGTDAELYVADRANSRIQVYDLDGGFKRVFGSDFLTSPSGFAVDGNRLIIAELRARLTVLDADDRPVCYLGSNEEVCDVDGWPNNRDGSGRPIRTRLLEPGKFNSPHGMAVDDEGNIYVSEWLIGGRFTKLVKR